MTPFFIPYAITNMGSALLAMELGFMGPNYSISTACATSNYCFYAAANHIRRAKVKSLVRATFSSVEIKIRQNRKFGFVLVSSSCLRYKCYAPPRH